MNAALSEKLLMQEFTNQGVSSEYLGVWKRQIWIDGQGNKDETTIRYWMQTKDWHADLSIKDERPDFANVGCLEECSQEQLEWLCSKQQGFAGITRLSGDLCHWDRQYDSSLRATPDIGQMRFDANGVHESGVLSKLYEYWERMPLSVGGTEFTVKGSASPRTDTLLLVRGSYFMFMRERPTASTTLLAIQRRITERKACRADLERFADFEMSFGCIDNSTWLVLHSTLPWCEGLPLTLKSPAIS